MANVPHMAKVPNMANVYKITIYMKYHWKIIPFSLVILSDLMKRVATAGGINLRWHDLSSV